MYSKSLQEKNQNKHDNTPPGASADIKESQLQTILAEITRQSRRYHDHCIQSSAWNIDSYKKTFFQLITNTIDEYPEHTRAIKEHALEQSFTQLKQLGHLHFKQYSHHTQTCSNIRTYQNNQH